MWLDKFAPMGEQRCGWISSHPWVNIYQHTRNECTDISYHASELMATCIIASYHVAQTYKPKHKGFGAAWGSARTQSSALPTSFEPAHPHAI